jgi:hypothetical protein
VSVLGTRPSLGGSHRTPATSIWRDTIVRANGRVSSRANDVAVAAELVSYLIGDEFMSEEDRHNLWTTWNKARGKDVEHPVDQIDDDLTPEDLPHTAHERVSEFVRSRT